MTTASQKTRLTRDVPAMASRHFWFIADTIHEQRNRLGNQASPEALRAIDQMAMAFANRLGASNSGFRKSQFLEACGVTLDACGNIIMSTDPDYEEATRGVKQHA